MNRLLTASGRHADLALAILRAVTGLVFFMHGWQKVFVFGMAGTTGAMTQMGAPMPEIAAPLVAAVELLGGLALIVGLFTRLAAIPLAIDMLSAIVIFHRGFFVPKGVEFVMLLGTAALVLAIAGPGAFSVDSWIRGRSPGGIAGARTD